MMVILKHQTAQIIPLKRTLAQTAANGRKEPKVYFEFSRCLHSQRQKCRASKTFGAAAQRKEQSFL